MERTYGLKIGNGFIRDLLNPRVEDIDLSAIDGRMRATRRFTNNPAALTLWQHVHLVAMIADKVRGHPSKLHRQVMDWARYHDDHEGIIGDIPGPLKNLIARHSDILSTIEAGLDRVICQRRGFVSPTAEVRKIVHAYDKIAETIEWHYVLGEPLGDWNWPIHETLDVDWIKESLDHVRRM